MVLLDLDFDLGSLLANISEVAPVSVDRSSARENDLLATG
jgi:hypothetical protein